MFNSFAFNTTQFNALFHKDNKIVDLGEIPRGIETIIDSTESIVVIRSVDQITYLDSSSMLVTIGSEI